MKLSDFEATVSKPAVYMVDWDSLRDQEITVTRNKTVVVAKYLDLRTTLLGEKIVEAPTSATGILKTQKAAYSELELWQDAPAWRLLRLDCYLEANGMTNVTQVMWCECDWHQWEERTYQTFFVVVARDPHTIVDGAFEIGADPAHDSPVAKWLEAGVWTRVWPKTKQTDPDDELARDIGRMRAAYKHFYEHSAVGSACALAPGNVRLDDLRYWVDMRPGAR